jgi:uncharacterized protein involved in type VI secretion and phage assembly
MQMEKRKMALLLGDAVVALRMFHGVARKRHDGGSNPTPTRYSIRTEQQQRVTMLWSRRRAFFPTAQLSRAIMNGLPV